MEAWIRALNETRRALAERDEWAERQEERRREAGKQVHAAHGGVPIPESGAHDQTTTGALSESMSRMSLGAHPEPVYLSGPSDSTNRDRSRGPSAQSGNEFATYGMTPVVSGLASGAAGIITSSESEDDGYAAHGVDIGSGPGVARTIEFDARQGPQQALGPGVSSPGTGFPSGGASTLATSLPINTSMATAPIQTDPHKVILSGYLTKLGNKRKTWRKRWFVLTSGELVYTKSHMVSLYSCPKASLLMRPTGHPRSSRHPAKLHARRPRTRCTPCARIRRRVVF